MKPPVVLGLVGMLLLSSQNARADAIVFPTSFTTSGTFVGCHAPIPCTGEGTNSITMGSGADTATITFTGVNTSVDVTNQLQDVPSLGEFSVTAPDGICVPGRSEQSDPAGDPELLAVAGSDAAGRRHRGPDVGVRARRAHRPQAEDGPARLVTHTGSSAYPFIGWGVNPFPFTLEPNATTDLSAKSARRLNRRAWSCSARAWSAPSSRANAGQRTIRRLEGEALPSRIYITYQCPPARRAVSPTAPGAPRMFEYAREPPATFLELPARAEPEPA